MRKLFHAVLLSGLLLMFSVPLKAQSFGFGCLGLVGGYGGYSYQVYQPDGLNNYISVYNGIRKDSLASQMGEFGTAKGFRVGANLFRANFDGLILTAKGFYQLLIEKNGSVVETDFGRTTAEFDLKLTSWGIGFDLGTTITGDLSWKVIDAALLFNGADFTNTQNFPEARTEVTEYSSDTNVGYSVGTGFIFSVIDRYISIEGLIAYSDIQIENVYQSDNTPLFINEQSQVPVKNFIEKGGFSAVIQLNLGFPL